MASRKAAGLDLSDLVRRDLQPEPWAEGEKIPWSDPEFSRRMLREHLSQRHDAASRRTSLVRRHVDWIHSTLLQARASRVLDLGCGPGLYTARLAALGHRCTGIDFSPASIAYAEKQARTRNLDCVYRLEDVRRADFGCGYELVMFIFGEFNVFRPADARRILRKACAALKPGGRLLLEVSSFDSVEQTGEQPSMWYTEPAGLWSDAPHLCLMESFWDEAGGVAIERYWIVDARTGAVSRHSASTQAYTDERFRRMLRSAGFRQVDFHPALTGSQALQPDGLFVIVAQK